MPEGDTVYLAAQRLDAALHGQIVTRSEFRVPRYAAVDLAGRSIREIFPRGKHLFFDLGDLSLHTHFKMQGSWHLYRPQQRWRKPSHHARIVLQTPQWTAVGFDLLVVELVADPDVVIRHLGPDLLSENFDAADAARRIMLDAARPLGDALTDQRVVAGLGNVYKSEVCFVAGIDPRTPVRLVADVPSVVRLARRMIRANRSTGSQITTGDTRPGRQHWVYGRGALPCLRCGTPISEQRDGSERVTYWCASCQRSS
ncbi:MAG: Fpg/Nei family DNA glycosylase [Actinomycetota bacterium]|nr:Fpg/Nei family DNA glycosylase [Actinomycetota bacterium]